MPKKKKEPKKPKTEPVAHCTRCGQDIVFDDIEEDSTMCKECQWDDADFVDSTYDPD